MTSLDWVEPFSSSTLADRNFTDEQSTTTDTIYGYTATHTPTYRPILWPNAGPSAIICAGAVVRERERETTHACRPIT